MNLAILSPARRAASLRAMAAQRRREADALLEAGDVSGSLNRLRDVEVLREEAERLERKPRSEHQDRVDEEDRRTARALTGILELAGRGR